VLVGSLLFEKKNRDSEEIECFHEYNAVLYAVYFLDCFDLSEVLID
jgi:hypothetical protein